jgi:hypothetical protein
MTRKATFNSGRGALGPALFEVQLREFTGNEILRTVHHNPRACLPGARNRQPGNFQKPWSRSERPKPPSPGRRGEGRHNCILRRSQGLEDLMKSRDPERAHAARRNLPWLIEHFDADDRTDAKACSKN